MPWAGVENGVGPVENGVGPEGGGTCCGAARNGGAGCAIPGGIGCAIPGDTVEGGLPKGKRIVEGCEVAVDIIVGWAPPTGGLGALPLGGARGPPGINPGPNAGGPLLVRPAELPDGNAGPDVTGIGRGPGPENGTAPGGGGTAEPNIGEGIAPGGGGLDAKGIEGWFTGGGPVGLWTAAIEGNVDCGGPLGGTGLLKIAPGRETGGPPEKGGGCWANGGGCLGALVLGGAWSSLLICIFCILSANILGL